MADNSATILIPDISGFTEFMTTTELAHSSQAINMLIDAMVNAVGEEYDVSEIEGDAVLLIRKGPAPSRKEIQEVCLKIFNGFHFQRRWLQLYAICPCGACQAIGNLTLKFVAHHGPLAEIKVGRFVKQSGTEMIVAHRLLKNSIDDNEYLLVSEKLFRQGMDASAIPELQWTSSSDEYGSLGKVDYRFATLHDARKNVPEPPTPPGYTADDTPYLEISIAAAFRDVYMTVMNIPERGNWLPGLQKVEQDLPFVFIGSVHRCSFEDGEAIISPLRMSLADDEIIYAESFRSETRGLSLVYEFQFQATGENSSTLLLRVMDATGGTGLAEPVKANLQAKLALMAGSLKDCCENGKTSIA